MTNKPMPLIKEARIDRIQASLKCIAAHPFDRGKQRDCILQLYPGKTEKSVFRGMVIPSLRYLGLVVGYAGGLRVSANGRIITDSENMSSNIHSDCLRAVMYEIDKAKFGLVDTIANAPVSLSDLIRTLAASTSVPDTRAKERVVSWLSILQQVGLVKSIESKLQVNEQNKKKTAQVLDISNLNIEEFRKTMFEEYANLAKKTAGIVDITDLRANVASTSLANKKRIITENMFDALLRQIPFASDRYLISFGRPMGAEEKLFRLQQDHYRTITITLLKD